jgi:hypothetical protein
MGKMSIGHWWDDNDREKSKQYEKHLSHCHFVNHNLTWSSLRSNLGLCGESMATNRLTHGTTLKCEVSLRNM